MKHILAIEIKDNKTIATLTKYIKGEHNLLFHKTYGSKPLEKSVLYDVSIIENLKEDLFGIGLFESINEAYLTINTKRTVIQTFGINVKYGKEIEREKEELTKILTKKYPQFKICSLELSDFSPQQLDRKISATVEFIEHEYFNEIEKQFRVKGINFTKHIPLITAIKNSSKIKGNEHMTTFSILVEEKFTQLTRIENGIVTLSTKWNEGLTNIYEHIATSMDLSKSSAKTLFKSFGSIPPEEVVDEKVIHSKSYGKELAVFTKKDLSQYITEKVNELFSNIKSKIDPVKGNKPIRIIFNGEIKSLIGFKKYAAKSFAEPNIIEFTNKMIGLNEETEFITTGILFEKKSLIEVSSNVKLNIPKINIFNRIIRMYNYI